VNGFSVELTGTPAIANGRVYFSSSEEMFCIGAKNAKPAPEPAPLAFPTKAGTKIAHLQVLPADVVVHPGESVTFKVKAFDENGIFIKEVTADKWMLPTPPLPPKAKMAPPPLDGQVADGKLTVGKMKPSQHGYVAAVLGDVVGKARVRVVPNLPYAQDFSKVPDGAVPGAWVNTQGKFLVKTLKDGNKVLAKVNTNSSPLFARGNAFFGLPSLTNYTIECDIQGTKVGDDMPDIGINANRYTMLLAGNIQKARLVSWDVLPRIDSTVPYPWKPGVWYRLKLTVELEKDKAIARGKVWESGTPEPKEWTCTAVDPRPNTEGSPGLYGYVTGILQQGDGTIVPGPEVYYDNLRVTPDKK
jgi:outer membrane protein assembly factor BamB